MAAIVSDFLLEKKIESRIDKVEDSEVNNINTIETMIEK